MASTTSTGIVNPKKRPLDDITLLQNSPYFKIRAFVNQLRPLFLQFCARIALMEFGSPRLFASFSANVLSSPDIQNCEASRGIQEKTKLMIDLCRQKTVENVPLVKCNNGVGSQDLAGEKPMSHDMKSTDQPPQVDRSFVRPGVGKQTSEGTKITGTYIVGGSAFGWNFVTFHGTKPEYYGRTKEAFRAGQ